MEVSRATKGELPEVLALLRRCELLENGVAEAIESFWVVRTEALVGCAGLEAYGPVGLLRSVAVAPSLRRMRVGTTLVDRVVTTAQTRGLRQLFLLTTTAPDFFRRRGFHPVERGAVPAPIAESWEFRVGCPQTAVAMRLDLKEP
jgi:N-acetylglutamate synthase-like GNAT family acetyltransferase